MKEGQTRIHSWYEAWMNIFIGFTINYIANLLVFPLFGYNITLTDNLFIGIIFTFISLARSYILRRWFNKLMIKGATNEVQPVSDPRNAPWFGMGLGAPVVHTESLSPEDPGQLRKGV